MPTWLLAPIAGLNLPAMGFDPSILRHSGIWGAGDEAVLNNVHSWKKIQENTRVIKKKEIKCSMAYRYFTNVFQTSLE